VTLAGEGAQLLEGRVRVGEVRLQHDAGIEAIERRLGERSNEGGDGQFEIVELLHVEIHEFCRVVLRCGPKQRIEPGDDAIDRVIERGDVELRAQSRDLY
jgi:hypothetical protein